MNKTFYYYLFGIFILFILFIPFTGCRQKSTDIGINLVDHKQLTVEEIVLSDLCESIQIIPLETSDSILIATISSIKIEAGKLYVQASNGVFAFDANGRFLNEIGHKGRGPREYLYLYDIFPENDEIWLVDNYKVLKYASTGLFLQYFDIERKGFIEYHHAEGDTFIGFIPDLGNRTSAVMLAFFNASGIVDSVLYNNPIRDGGGGTIVNYMRPHFEAQFINYRDQLKYKFMFNDTTYRIINNKLYPDVVLHLGSGKANEKGRLEMSKQPPDIAGVIKGMDRVELLGESDRYLYYSINNAPLFYDKKEQKAHKWNFILPTDERLDPEQSKKFVPIYIDKNGNLIGQTAPASIEDNPVVVVAKLKR